jgi:glycosyltransferase involved in cell wall biosynthesis
VPTHALPERAPVHAGLQPRPLASSHRVGRPPHPLRVALFTEQGHPDGSFTSGVTRLTRHFWKHCAARELPLDVFTYHERPGETRVGSVRFHAVRPRTPLDFHGLKVDPWDVLPVRNRTLTDRALDGWPAYDVLLATAPGIGTQAQLVARRLGVPLVMMFTTDLPNYAAELVRDLARLRPLAEGARGAAWAYLRWLYDRSRTDLVLAPTHAVRRELQARVTATVSVLGRGNDTLSFDAPADLRRQGPPAMLYVGRLDYGQKNLSVLVRAVREIAECRLVLVGDGEHRGRLEQELAAEIGSGRVRLLGRLDDPNSLREAYRSADWFAFPSVFDTLGQVVVEAQRAGLPVVVRDRGGPAELVADGRSGFVTESDDAFIARCRELARDAELRVRMGQAAWTHAAGLPTWDQVVERLLGRLRAVVRARREGAPVLVLDA